MQEEIFGPVLPLVTFKRESEVLSVIEARPRPLVLYIFSPEKEFIEHILERTHSGDVVINDVVTHYANIQLPFGGVNNSGIGKTHGMYGFKEFSHLRSVMRRGKVSPARLFYPPYNQTVKRMIDLLLKYL
jgi:aldehyde dehydrogenase (NAD+)